MQLHIYIALSAADSDEVCVWPGESRLWSCKARKVADRMPDRVCVPLTILEVITPCVVYKHVKNKQWPRADPTLQNNFKACGVV